jgi:hypothetical protein
MANPNIVNVATINGNANYGAVGTGSPDTQILSNAASSGKIFKVNSLYIANIDGTNSVDVSVRVYTQAGLAGTANAILSTAPVAADSTLVVVTKDTALYILENSSIGVFASASGDATFHCSWDEIS